MFDPKLHMCYLKCVPPKLPDTLGWSVWSGRFGLVWSDLLRGVDPTIHNEKFYFFKPELGCIFLSYNTLQWHHDIIRIENTLIV